MNYYEILQVEKTSTQDEIKQAYKKLVIKNHPDKGGSKEQFQKIQEAYETLSDENKRRQYDNPVQNMFEGGMPGGFPFNFNDFFGGSQGVKKKVDHYYNLKVSLYDVYFGLKKTLNIKHDIKCEKCNKKCSICKGHGKVQQRLNMGMMQIIQEQPCMNCNGYGILKDSVNCDECSNTGIKVQKNTIEIIVPKGAENDKQIIFKGLGEQPKTENEVAGDFIVTIKVDMGVLFKRNGLDLTYESSITFKESVVGKMITISHFEKEIQVNTRDFGIINPNKKYIIHGKGLRNERDNHGNLYIQFNIDYTKIGKLTNEQIEILDSVL